MSKKEEKTSLEQLEVELSDTRVKMDTILSILDKLMAALSSIVSTQQQVQRVEPQASSILPPQQSAINEDALVKKIVDAMIEKMAIELETDGAHMSIAFARYFANYFANIVKVLTTAYKDKDALAHRLDHSFEVVKEMDAILNKAKTPAEAPTLWRALKYEFGQIMKIKDAPFWKCPRKVLMAFSICTMVVLFYNVLYKNYQLQKTNLSHLITECFMSRDPYYHDAFIYIDSLKNVVPLDVLMKRLEDINDDYYHPKNSTRNE